MLDAADAADAAVVRRYMELHRERLQERLADRLRRLADLEEHLVRSIVRDGGASR